MRFCAALSLAILVGCASTTVTARYDASGRLRACHIHTGEVARVVTATCTPDALTVHHAPESGWAERLIGAVGGWLAAKVGM